MIPPITACLLVRRAIFFSQRGGNRAGSSKQHSSKESTILVYTTALWRSHLSSSNFQENDFGCSPVSAYQQTPYFPFSFLSLLPCCCAYVVAVAACRMQRLSKVITTTFSFIFIF
jgi:hypothetical protein